MSGTGGAVGEDLAFYRNGDQRGELPCDSIVLAVLLIMRVKVSLCGV